VSEVQVADRTSSAEVDPEVGEEKAGGGEEMKYV